MRRAVVPVLAAAGLAALAASGCAAPRCDLVVFKARIDAGLDAAWDPAAAGRLVLSIRCPGGDPGVCGFLGPEPSAPATTTVTAWTLLRPPRVTLLVTDVSTAAVVQQLQADLDYQPVGPQSHCGGEAHATVVVPPPFGGTARRYASMRIPATGWRDDALRRPVHPDRTPQPEPPPRLLGGVQP